MRKSFDELTIADDFVLFKVGGSNSTAIKLTSPVNGTVTSNPAITSGATGIQVPAGTKITFMATPNSAYEVDGWTEVSPTPPNAETATLTVGDVTVKVRFKQKTTGKGRTPLKAGGPQAVYCRPPPIVRLGCFFCNKVRRESNNKVYGNIRDEQT